MFSDKSDKLTILAKYLVFGVSGRIDIMQAVLLVNHKETKETREWAAQLHDDGKTMKNNIGIKRNLYII